MRIFTTLAATVFIGAFSRPALAEDLPVGNWTGFAVRMNANGNQNRQPVALAVRKAPDPHVAWRGGSGELTSLVFGNPANNAANAWEVSGVAFGDGRLTFTFTAPDPGERTDCALLLQPKEGTYVGDCLGGGYDRRVTLTPPAPQPAADAVKPAPLAK